MIFVSEHLKESSEEEMQLKIQYEAYNGLKCLESVTFNDFYPDDDIVTSNFPTVEDIVELYRSTPESEQPNNTVFLDKNILLK